MSHYHYRVLGRSVIHPGNVLLEDESGACFIYFAGPGELSATSLDHSLAEAILQSYEWSRATRDEWVTVPDLQANSYLRISTPYNSTDDTQPEFH